MGDVFFYVAPDGIIPSGQTFATMIIKDYPNEPSAGLDRPGSFHVNVVAARPSEPSPAQVGSAADPWTPAHVVALVRCQRRYDSTCFR